MEDYIPGRVYNNLVKMMGYRGVAITSDIIDTSTLSNKLNHYEYVMITGTRPASDPRGAATVAVFLIAPNSKYSSKSMDFKKLFKSLPQSAVPIEVIIVSENELTTHINKVLDSAQVPNATFETHDYEMFLIEIPKHASVPEHIIPPREEIEKFCRDHYTTPANFSRITTKDPPAVWLGIKPGMVVKIKRISETAGIAIAYRICVK